MTIKQAQSKYCATLKKRGVVSAFFDVDVLISFVLKKPNEFIFSHPEASLTPTQTRKLTKLVGLRARHMPIAYLTGIREFFGYDFVVSRSALIPRPETEMLVEEALTIIGAAPERPWRVIDVGTGSGAIIVALTRKILESGWPIKKYSLSATEYSAAALNLARSNALNLAHSNASHLSHTNTPHPSVAKYIKFSKADLLSGVLGKFDIVIANLPYLSLEEYVESPYLDILRWEPKMALTDGADGLKHFRNFIKQCPDRVNPHATILFEIGSEQAFAIRKLIKTTFPKADIGVKKDLCGFNRVIRSQI